ncbi:MAG: ferritin family protein [Spirochaetales bacterium]
MNWFVRFVLLTAHGLYLKYAERALQEHYPHIARLAAALSVSEGIHALNCQKVLADLGVAPAPYHDPKLSIADTPTNLSHASAAELDEIDTRYPAYLERIKVENVTGAIGVITRSWQAERQHRDLIERLRQGSGFLFGVMVQALEALPDQYYVCSFCGSTLTWLPSDKCPICEGPVSRYNEVTD